MRHLLLFITVAALCSCSNQRPGVAAPFVRAVDQPLAPAASLRLRVNTSPAIALLDALEQNAISDAEIDRLLADPDIGTMVENTTKYVPDHDRGLFRQAMKEVVETRQSTIGRAFRLGETLSQAAEIRSLIARLGGDPDLEAEVVGPLRPYLPAGVNLNARAVGIVGGASDGFVPDESKEAAFFMALNRAGGDMAGVKLNMTHELYHVVQRAARASVPGLDERVFDLRTAPPATRLMTVMIEEGTATLVAEPMLVAASGRYIDMWREGYSKNRSNAQIQANFRDFDRIFAGLEGGSISWADASKEMFTGVGSPLYFVGYEMAKAIARRHGAARISESFAEHPALFFRTYVELSRKCGTCVPARFSPATESRILAYQLD